MLNFWWKKKANFQIRNGAAGSRGRSKIAAFFLWVFCIGIALWFVHPRTLSWIGVQIAIPFGVLGGWYESSTSVIPSYFRGVNQLRAENNALQAALDKTTTERAQYLELQRENALLRHLTDGSVDGEYVLAGVLATSPYIPHDLMIIDRGTNHAIGEGMHVYDDKKRALGIVRTVYSDRTIVQLFSSPSALTTVYVPSVRLFASAEGMGGGIIRVRIPQDIKLEVGALVVLPGIESAHIGTVTYLEAEPTNPEQSAYITTFAPHVHQFVRIDTRQRIIPSFEELRGILRDYSLQLGDIELPAAYVKEPYVSTTTTSTGTTSASTTHE